MYEHPNVFKYIVFLVAYLVAKIFFMCRYVICENLLEQDSTVQEYLQAVNLNLIQLKQEKPHLDILNVSNKRYDAYCHDCFPIN
jgi:lipid A disaccharide synthetase